MCPGVRVAAVARGVARRPGVAGPRGGAAGPGWAGSGRLALGWVDAFLEVWSAGGVEHVALDGDRTAIGRAASNDVPLPHDSLSSRVHAVLERYASGWSIRDVGSTNGTRVNGETIDGERALREGDEITVGGTRVVFRAYGRDGEAATVAATDRPPRVTQRERDVLIALCRPVVGPSPFAQPATLAEIAAALFVSEATVKFHLSNLYDKFGIGEPSSTRRARLAEAALVRGAVQRTELRETAPAS